MKPDKEDTRQPLDQRELERLPRATLAKNMRNVEDIMADYIANGVDGLTRNEQRLLDLKLREKTGKHLDKFKPENVKPSNKPVDNNFPSVGKHDEHTDPDKKKKLKPLKMTTTFEPDTVS